MGIDSKGSGSSGRGFYQANRLKRLPGHPGKIYARYKIAEINLKAVFADDYLLPTRKHNFTSSIHELDLNRFFLHGGH